ncbi:MAG: BamA/TamA family outer membrane protein [Chitinophagales bacterium]
MLRLLTIIVFLFFTRALCAQNEATDTLSAEENTAAAEKRSQLSGYPYVYYTPETSLAFGVGGIYTFYTSPSLNLSPSSITIGGYYTINNQYKVTLKPIVYAKDDAFYFSLPIAFGHYIDKFYGVGTNTPEIENADYLKDVFDVSLIVQGPPFLFACDRLGLIIDFNKTIITEAYKQENILLESDSLFGVNGGWNVGIGGELVWDSRDNVFYPTTGSYQRIKMVSYPFNNELIFANFETDVRQYYNLKNKNVFAAQFFLTISGGETPFYKLSSLGGQYRMRGYYEGRYRDNVYMMMQAEYRQYFYKNFGFVAFAGAGNVSNNITKFSIDNVKISYGGGLRYLFNKKEGVNLRADYGRTLDNSSGFYFGIEEAF